MLSMLLGTEDDEPSWNSWSPTVMQGDHHHIVAFVHPSMFALCHEPWSQLFLIPSSPPSMLSLTAGSSSTSFSSNSRTEYVLNHHSIANCLKLSFQRVAIHPDRTPNKRVTPFLLCWCMLSEDDFRCVTPKDLVVTSCTGLLKCWLLMHCKVDLMEHLNIQFFPFVHLWTCA
jgi:hypothetical protein